MVPFYCTLFAFFLLGSSMHSAADVAVNQQRVAQQVQLGDTQIFTDEKYGYSVRYPSTWKAQHGDIDAVRFMLNTPNGNLLSVGIQHLERPVTRYTTAIWEQIFLKGANRAIDKYFNLFQLKQILRQEKENRSDDKSMKFWHAMSALSEPVKLWAIVSLHAVPYGSNVMVDIAFFGEQNVEKDGEQVTAIMNSLTFSPR